MLKLSELKSFAKSGELKKSLLEGERVRRIYVTTLIITYAIVVLWIVVFKCNNNAALHIEENLQKTLWERFTYRLEPFVDLRYLIRSGEFDSLETLAFLFNILCFTPLSMLISFLVRDRWNIAIACLFSTAIEVFQLFSGFGGFDPTDIFLNTLGGVIGCLLIKPLRRRFSETTTNAVLLGFVPPMTVWAIIAVIRTVIYFPV